MLTSKSFIDVLFILLLGTLVMLTQAVQLGAVDTEVAKLGAGGISPLRADEIQVIVVREDDLWLDGRPSVQVHEVIARIRPQDPVLLITGDRTVSHHRVMAIWSALRERQLDVKLGAQPVSTRPAP